MQKIASFLKSRLHRRKDWEEFREQTITDRNRAEGVFDGEWYLSANPDVAESGEDPFHHYMRCGHTENRNPGPEFDTAFYKSIYSDVAAEGVNPLLHYMQHGRSEGRVINARMLQPGQAEEIRRSLRSSGRIDPASKRIVADSGLFDAAYYLRNNTDVGISGQSPLDHYMTHGWREYRNPSAAFDGIWYAQVYLDSKWDGDPLLHYLVTGKGKGYLPSPRSLAAPTRPAGSLPVVDYRQAESPPRRICLFAGYDPDGLIDPVVVEYIRDLSRHADIYYLADCTIAPQELAKLEGVTRGAWSRRHGCYDFGSWSLLARELVGWDVIDGYDELVLANDSCYLMKPFDGVFREMDGRVCDWWGLQATKGLAHTFAAQALPGTVDLDTLKREYLPDFENQDVYDFLIGSYFTVFRKTIISDNIFRKILNNVKVEIEKVHIIRKYEVGITRVLISLGYDFDCYIRDVYPVQPIYTDICFDLIEKGFPLLKKYHLIENHYEIPSLGDWPERVKSAGVTKDLSPYQANLNRTGDAFRIHKNSDPELFAMAPPLSETELIATDAMTPKYDNWWAFPVCAYSHRFNDNIRALFEHVKDDPSLKKIVLTRSKHFEMDEESGGRNVVIVPLESREGQFYLLRSRHIFLKHSVKSNVGVELSPELHHFHNLWHGIPLKRIHYASLDMQDRLDEIARGNRLLTSVIAASRVDQNAMAVSWWPLTINDVWLTGLPRHDLILKPEALLPADMQQQLHHLRSMLEGRKLLLFAPTFRADQNAGYFRFTPEHRDALAALLAEKGYVMGVREHMADKARHYSGALTGEQFIAVPESVFPCVEMLLREADIVATDYSSTFVDFLLTGRPVVSFAYDYEHYVQTERGLFYDLEWSFPGNIAKSFPEFVVALEKAMGGMDPEETARYEQRKRLFLDYGDDGNSARVAERVRALNKGDTTLYDTHGKQAEAMDARRIVWVYDPQSEPCSLNRMYNLLPELEAKGWKNRLVPADDLSVDHMAGAGVLIFRQVPGNESLLDMAETFRRAGGLVIADIDAPLFDARALKSSAYYRDRPDRQADLRQRCMGFQRLMELAHRVAVPTPVLASLIDGKGARAVYVPSPLGSVAITGYSGKKSRAPEGRDRKIRLCYRAGAYAGGDDFRFLCQSVRRVLAERSDVEFHFVGDHLAIEGVDGWIGHRPFSQDALHAFLERMDINLAPLASGTFSQCGGETSLAEAAIHGVPSIASPSPSHEAFVREGRSGLIAGTEEEWYAALLRFINDAALRDALGQAARDVALAEFSASRITDRFIRDVLDGVEV